MAQVARPIPADMVEIERADAWFRYLAETRNLIGYRYDEVEPWAWQRLEYRINQLEERPVLNRGGS